MLRAFCSDWNGDAIIPQLTREELHHLIRVRRVRVGERIEILNGRGAVLSCVVTAVNGRQLDLELADLALPAMPEVGINLMVSVPKGKTFPSLLHKAVELGVAEITPLITDNSEVDADRLDGKANRWDAVLVEAVKQSGNPWMPRLHAPRRLEACLNALGDGALSLCAALQSDSRPLLDVLQEISPKKGTINILIGPEGDFSQREYELLRTTECRFVSLGPIVLKVETAACLAAGVVSLFSQTAEF